MLALENIIKRFSEWEGWPKCKKRSQEGDGSEFPAQQLLEHLKEKEEFQPTPAHSQLVSTMSGQHTLHRQSGDHLKAQSRNCAGQSEKNRHQQGGTHVSGENYSALV